MALENTNISTTDLYKINMFVDSIKSKYIDIPEDTLVMGTYGYLGSVLTNAIENTAIMASEYSAEAIPTKAKYERNVIAHALSLGINDIQAKPAEIDMLLGLSETALINNMVNNKFILDKEFVFKIGERERYPYKLDYDIIITRDKLPNGTYVYNAKYDIDGKNPLAMLTNPYLPALGKITVSGDVLITLQVTLRQLTHTQVYKKIIMNNPLENKIFNFSYKDQLSYFYVEVIEDGETHYLVPMYDGLYTTNEDEFINYLYLDESNIRLRFNRDSYQPKQNAEVTINIFTTLGDECNFSLAEDYSNIQALTSERFSYNGLYVLLQSMSDSQYGEDKKSIADLKQAIPKEAISRGSVTTYTDLNNVFNHMNEDSDDCKLYFLERIHNQIERLYFCYLVLRDGQNIVHTNTIKASFNRGMFSSTSKDNFSMKPGAMFYLDPDTEEINGKSSAEEDEIEKMDKSSFLYMNPFLTIVNKSPFYVSYYHVLVNYDRLLYFNFVNDKSLLQFVSMNFFMHRDFYTDPDTYKIEISAVQNINSDFELVTYDSNGDIESSKFDLYAVVYNVGVQGKETPIRYMKAKLVKFNESDSIYDFQFSFKTNDVISSSGTMINITSGMKSLKSTIESSIYIPTNVRIKFFYLVKFDEDYGRMYGENLQENLDDLIPNLEGYTLTNIYSPEEAGLDIFYDYTDIQQSYINLSKGSDGDFTYIIHKMPVVRYTYLNTEERITNLFHQIDMRKRYIQNVLLLLEDSFGIDYKFFNTYGKSLMYNINNEENIDRINLSLKFEIKFKLVSDQVVLDQITNSIKEYIEDLNTITDLHIPNLITYITNIYREQLVYIKFIRLNNYDSLYQSIYKNPIFTDDYFTETQTVPEFINVNTLPNGLADITYDIIS